MKKIVLTSLLVAVVAIPTLAQGAGSLGDTTTEMPATGTMGSNQDVMPMMRGGPGGMPMMGGNHRGMPMYGGQGRMPMMGGGHRGMPMMHGGQSGIPMMGGKHRGMPMHGGQDGMPMMGNRQMMMQHKRAMMHAHMQGVEQRLANIEALLQQLVEFQQR